MTLYRIYGGRFGIDYYERSKELGFVIADSEEEALVYARTLDGFAKPDNGYDADLIRSGMRPAASEGYLQKLYPFVMTPENFANLQEGYQRKQELLEQKQHVQEELDDIDKKLKTMT